MWAYLGLLCVLELQPGGCIAFLQPGFFRCQRLKVSKNTKTLLSPSSKVLSRQHQYHYQHHHLHHDHHYHDHHHHQHHRHHPQPHEHQHHQHLQHLTIVIINAITMSIITITIITIITTIITISISIAITSDDKERSLSQFCDKERSLS